MNFLSTAAADKIAKPHQITSLQQAVEVSGGISLRKQAIKGPCKHSAEVNEGSPGSQLEFPVENFLPVDEL